VWWDREIVPGQHFGQEIERALTAAKAVVVLWSPAAAAAVAADNPAARIAGVYRGAIISDSQGQSRTGIELLLTRTMPTPCARTARRSRASRSARCASRVLATLWSAMTQRPRCTPTCANNH
jgi:hypothetical protein